ncbi:MAG: methionyl-tRNA formyltransferase [Pseudomonadota bacterium]
MSVRDLRIVFAGTPEFAAVHLRSLIEAGCKIVSAYSQPDRPSGRGKKILPTPVKAVALSAGIPTRQPISLRTEEAQAELAALAPDLMIVVAYGLLLPQEILDTPRLGCINVHASLLPRWRGAAPIERAILAGDAETGITIMQMDKGLDTGPMLAAPRTPILDEDNSATLTRKLEKLGCKALLEILERLTEGSVQSTHQDNQAATYAHKLRKDEAGIIWDSSAETIHQQIRAFFPRSPAYCLYGGQRLRIITARAASQSYSNRTPGSIVRLTQDSLIVACGVDSLEIYEVQLEGKTPMTLSVLSNGHPDFFEVGAQLLSAVAHDQDHK